MVFGIGFYILRVTFTCSKGIIPITSLLNLLTPHVVLDQNRQYAACGNSFLCLRVLHPTWILHDFTIFDWQALILMHWRVTRDSAAVPTFWVPMIYWSIEDVCGCLPESLESYTRTSQYDIAITFLCAYSESGRLTFDFWHCRGQSPLGGRGAAYQHRSSPTLLSTSPALFIRPRSCHIQPASCPFSSGLSGAASVPKLLYVAQNQP